MVIYILGMVRYTSFSSILFFSLLNTKKMSFDWTFETWLIEYLNIFLNFLHRVFTIAQMIVKYIGIGIERCPHSTHFSDTLSIA